MGGVARDPFAEGRYLLLYHLKLDLAAYKKYGLNRTQKPEPPASGFPSSAPRSAQSAIAAGKCTVQIESPAPPPCFCRSQGGDTHTSQDPALRSSNRTPGRARSSASTAGFTWALPSAEWRPAPGMSSRVCSLCAPTLPPPPPHSSAAAADAGAAEAAAAVEAERAASSPRRASVAATASATWRPCRSRKCSPRPWPGCT